MSNPPDINPSHTAWDGFEYTPRRWQKDVLPVALDAIQSEQSGIISAVMGAGKSAVIGEICASLDLDKVNPVVITTPTIRLVKQLYETISGRIGAGNVGLFYTDHKFVGAVTICCVDSVESLAHRMEKNGQSCSLWIADEAHKTECDTIIEAHEHLGPCSQIGFTATPFRSSEKEELSLWQNLIFEYDHRQAIKDGVVVPPKVRHYQGDRTMLDEVCIEMIRNTLSEGYGPGMVNALTIDRSEHLNSTGAIEFASKLRGAGVRAESVHSQNADETNEHRLAMLEHGELDCVVHVNQLAEGANFPWMQWLCLRRPTSSRVRFCQEVGRVLRSHGQKTHGLVLDPLDLFETFGLTGDYEAVLEGDAYSQDTPVEKAATEVDEIIDDMKTNPDSYGTTSDRIAAIIGPARSWVRKTKMALSNCGYIEQTIKSNHWRSDPPTKNQLQSFRFAWTGFDRKVPDKYTNTIKTVYRIAANDGWKKGDMSDLLSIAYAVNDNGWPEDVERLVN